MEKEEQHTITYTPELWDDCQIAIKVDLISSDEDQFTLSNTDEDYKVGEFEGLIKAMQTALKEYKSKKAKA